MKKILATLDLKPHQTHHNAIESMEAAAARWGVEFIRIEEPVEEGTAFFQKLRLPKKLKDEHGDCRVAQIDSDMVIRDDCPSLFDQLPEDHIGFVAVKDRSPKQQRFIWRSHKHWGDKINLRPAPCFTHPNGGLWIYNTAEHSEMIDHLGYHDCFDRRTLYKVMDEATMINAAWSFHGEQITYLPQSFNTILADYQQLTRSPRLASFIYHYVARYKWMIEHAQWQNGGIAQHYDPGSPQGTTLAQIVMSHAHAFGPMNKGVEVGVLRGASSAALLSNLPELQLYGVDPYGPYEPDPDKPWGDFNQLDSHTKRSFRYVGDAMWHVAVNGYRWHPVRETSQRASRMFDEGELDWVFIDARHTYHALKDDISYWLPKIRKGGLLIGHDYSHLFPGVCKCVDEFAELNPTMNRQHHPHAMWSFRV